MLPEHRIPVHPGVVLAQEFLAPLGISQLAFAGSGKGVTAPVWKSYPRMGKTKELGGGES